MSIFDFLCFKNSTQYTTVVCVLCNKYYRVRQEIAATPVSLKERERERMRQSKLGTEREREEKCTSWEEERRRRIRHASSSSLSSLSTEHTQCGGGIECLACQKSVCSELQRKKEGGRECLQGGKKWFFWPDLICVCEYLLSNSMKSQSMCVCSGW